MKSSVKSHASPSASTAMSELAPSQGRRRLVKGMAAAGLSMPFIVRAAEPITLYFASVGGSYGTSIKTNFVVPFEQQTGIKVDLSANATLAPLKVQVQSKNVQWDLADLGGGEFLAGLRDDLFEPIDTSIVDLRNVPDYAQHRYGILHTMFLSGMTYDQRKIPDQDAPKTWAEFCDTKRYQGMRSLGRLIAQAPTLELAVMAAGVPMSNIYPLDVQLAFESLRKLGRDNIQWYMQAQEPINFLERQDGPLAQAANARVQIARRSGSKLGFVFNQMQSNGNYLVVPKGARNKEAAFRLMNFMLTNDRAAMGWMTDTHYAFSNIRAAGQMPPDVASKLPTSPEMKGKFFVKNFEWWGANFDKVVVEFNRFIAT